MGLVIRLDSSLRAEEAIQPRNRDEQAANLQTSTQGPDRDPGTQWANECGFGCAKLQWLAERVIRTI